MDREPGPEAEEWLRLQSVGGPWYKLLSPEERAMVSFKPQHLGEDADPWRLETIQPGPPRVQAELGTELPLIPRTPRCPGYLSVPELVSKGYDNSTVVKRPKLYVLAFPGCADAVNAGWARMEIETPENFEWATYEWPGHGERQAETRLSTIAELGGDAFDTFREAMSCGHFMLVGHSIGVLVMTYVSMRAEQELGVKPLQCFVLDRTAPHQTVYSPYAEYLRSTDPVRWLSIWNHSVYQSLMSGLDGARDPAEQLRNDEGVQLDTLPLGGSYKFPCKINVFIALWVSTKAPRVEDTEDEGFKAHLRERLKYYCNAKGYNFAPEEFEEWRKWADDVAFFKVETDHKGVVTHNRFLTVLYREVAQVLKKSEKASKKSKGR